MRGKAAMPTRRHLAQARWLPLDVADSREPGTVRVFTTGCDASVAALGGTIHAVGHRGSQTCSSDRGRSWRGEVACGDRRLQA
jgi:hypothetical protein